MDDSEPTAKNILELIKKDIVSIEDHSVLLNEKKRYHYFFYGCIFYNTFFKYRKTFSI